MTPSDPNPPKAGGLLARLFGLGQADRVEAKKEAPKEENSAEVHEGRGAGELLPDWDSGTDKEEAVSPPLAIPVKVAEASPPLAIPVTPAPPPSPVVEIPAAPVE